MALVFDRARFGQEPPAELAVPSEVATAAVVGVSPLAGVGLLNYYLIAVAAGVTTYLVIKMLGHKP